MEQTLEKVVKLLAYISDKDLFSEFYRKKLARRLLNDGSASDDNERAILARLKQQCGAQFTSKVGFLCFRYRIPVTDRISTWTTILRFVWLRASCALYVPLSNMTAQKNQERCAWWSSPSTSSFYED